MTTDWMRRIMDIFDRYSFDIETLTFRIDLSEISDTDVILLDKLGVEWDESEEVFYVMM